MYKTATTGRERMHSTMDKRERERERERERGAKFKERTQWMKERRNNPFCPSNTDPNDVFPLHRIQHL